MNTPPEQAAGTSDAPTVAGGLSRAQRREKAACDALRTLVREYCLQHFGTRISPRQSFPLSLRFKAGTSENWDLAFDPPFETQIQGQLAEAEAQVSIYRQGSVYCFRCESGGCTHALPPDPGMVFRGYSSTGVPEWFAFVQALIDARDERVDALYAKPPTVLSCFQTGRELRNQQLAAFGRGSHTYSILGQVVAGYYSLRGRGASSADRGDDRLAVTFQVVETRGARGGVQIRFNMLVGGFSPDRWEERLVSDWQPTLSRAVGEVRAALANVEVRLQAMWGVPDNEHAVKAVFQEVPRLLHRFARSLERGGRLHVRRTQHAEDRHADRPVHKAMDDALQASSDGLFYDERRETFVARGRQGRVHVFSPDGRHVTSLMMQPGSVEFRLRTRRWRVLSAEEAADLKARLRRVQEAGSERGPVAGDSVREDAKEL